MKNSHLERLSIAAAVLPLMLTACQLLPAEEELPAAPVIHSYEAAEYKQTAVIRGDLSLTRRVPCEYVPASKEQLAFSLGGEYIDRICVAEGDQVQPGQLLAELVKDDLTEQIAAQEYEIQVLELKQQHLEENMALELSRLEALHVGAKQKQEAREKYEQQLQETGDSLYIQGLCLEELRSELELRQLRAGIGGTVTFVRSLAPGQRSTEGRVMITIADMTSTAFTVKGDDAAYFPPGTHTFIQQGGRELEAVSVDAAELGITNSEETSRAYLRLIQPDPTLEDGVKGYIELTLDSRQDVLYVSKKAIKTAGNRRFVYLLDENDLKVTRDVTTGLEAGDFVEITSGLSEGESVIIG